MAQIDLSAGWVTPMIPRLFRLTDGGLTGNSATAANSGLLHSGITTPGGVGALVFLMKGAVPTDFSTLTTINSRASDILCTFRSGQNTAGDFLTSQVNTNPVNVSSQYAAATGSGTCTWFWQVIAPTLYTGSYIINNAGSLYNQFLGTVGTSGSGADLEIPSTSIVTGELYRIRNLRIQFPTTWTY